MKVARNLCRFHINTGMSSLESSKTLMERRQYRNPPIEEAICEFGFAPGLEADVTFPGLFREKIKHQYPGKPRLQQAFQAQFEVGPLQMGSQMKSLPGKVLFPTADDKR